MAWTRKSDTLTGGAVGCWRTQLIYVVLLATVGVGAAAAGDCPRDVERRVEGCMAEITIAPQAGGGMALVKDVQQTQILCQRGLLQKSADCMDKLRQRCASDPKELSRLDKLFNVQSWRRGTRLMCDNSERLVDNNDCMKAAAPDVTKCIVLLTNSYRQQMEDIASFNSSELAKQLSCSYTGSMMNCLKRPLQKTCPDDVTDLLVGVMEAFLPPACWTNRTQDLADVTVVTNTVSDTEEKKTNEDESGRRGDMILKDDMLAKNERGITKDLDAGDDHNSDAGSGNNSASAAALSMLYLLPLVVIIL